MEHFYVYILRCAGNQLYTGFTRNLKKRIMDHKSGNGSEFTKNRLPLKLVYYEVFNDFHKGKDRENQIKGWRREKKENLIKYGKPIV